MNSDVVYGTTQGSVLGPLVYIIYVNDVLQKMSSDMNTLMYADDMLIVAQIKDLNTMTSVLQKGLDTILQCCNHNKLTVNKDKTKYMLISNKEDNLYASLMIRERPLCKVTQYEYLGVIIDQDLEMVTQIDSIFKKASLKLGILSKIRRFITEDTAV